MQRSAVACSVAMDTKTDSLFNLWFFFFSASLRTHTLQRSLHSLCSQIQHSDSLSNKKPPYLPFSGTFQQAAFYNIQVEKIKSKGGWKNAITQNWTVTTVHFSLWGMLGIGLTESAPFTASFFPPSFAALLSLREGAHSSQLLLYSRLGFGPAESLVGPKVMRLSDKQWLSLARRKPRHPRPPCHVCRVKNFTEFLILCMVVCMDVFLQSGLCIVPVCT